MAKATLKIIANALDISVATVSKALKDYPDISATTKQRVLELADSLNYTPNAFAQSLRTRESKIVGLIIPKIVHHFFSNIIDGVIHSASEKGYLVITLQTEEDYEKEKRQLQLLVDKNIDGILLSLSDKTVQYDHIMEIIDQGIPVVLYDKITKSIDCSKVIIDDKKAAFNATEYLIKTGCRKIAHIRGPLKPQTTIDRFIGYKQALEANNIPLENSLIYLSHNLSFEDGYNAAGKMMKEHPDVDGVFAFTDLVATGVLVRLRELKVKVPDQVSIIGFSNWFLSKITSPSLSTVDQPGYNIGRKAFGLLYNQLQQIKNGEPVQQETVEISTKIIPRNSTKEIIQ
jgi:LacI family transcriptional regulator